MSDDSLRPLRSKAASEDRGVAEALALEDRLLKRLIENSKDLITRVDAEGRFTYVNGAASMFFGIAPEDCLGLFAREFIHPADREATRRAFEAWLDSRPDSLDFENRAVSRDGTVRRLHWTAVADRNDAGDVVGLSSIGRDVTAFHEQQRLLRDSQALAHVGSWRIRVRDDAIAWSEETYRLLGLPPNRPAAPTRQEFLELLHPDDRPRMRAWFQACLGGQQPPGIEFRTQPPSGPSRWLIGYGVLEVDATGAPESVVGTVQDITDRKLADEKRAGLEAQLRQAQKMEALGLLAGGIAHDFNNVLAIIVNAAQLASLKLEPGHPVTQELQDVTIAAERAAMLTRQLLAFSRQQVVAPEVLQLDELARSLEPMIRRLIPADIAVNVDTADSAPVRCVRADPAQIEQILINLVVNARDAMPDGGSLTVAVRNGDFDATADNESAAPKHGACVVLSVSDTGVGMTEQQRQRIFEPFFTTKTKGTGLGLAVVHGIASQHGGSISVVSAVGQGTTIAVRLPAVEGTALTHKTAAATGIQRGTETVLVVEDQPELLALVRRVLMSAGYTVLTALDGTAALTIVQSHDGPLDLVLTDVVMPGGLGGPALAAQLAEFRPEIKVLLTSGYFTDAETRHSVRDSTIPFIGKPYTIATLTQKVREVLDR